MKKTIVLIICMWASFASAQVQVVESGSSQVPPRGRNDAAANNSNELMISFYNQMEALQQEVQTLRGLVEEQAYQIKLLETETKDRYLDMDRRLSSLSSGGVVDTNAPISSVGNAPGSAMETQVGDVRIPVQFNPALQASTEPGADTKPSVLPALEIEQMSEQDIYRTALNLLLEEGNSADAAILFQNYLDLYPTGRLLPNALYWQGEALILVARYPQAAVVFDRVIKEFPADAKAAGAMLKLGVAYNLMGDRGLAEQTWRDLAVRYPESISENTLAKDYLNKK